MFAMPPALRLRRPPCLYSRFVLSLFLRKVALPTVLVLCPFLLAWAGTPGVTLSPSSLTFGTQLKNTSSPPQTITLTNSGTATLTITRIRSTLGAVFSQTNSCGASLSAGASCTITVTFSPLGAGVSTASISVTDNATGSPHLAPLSGTGTILSLTPATVSFGSQTVGIKSAAQPVTITNVGNASVRVSSYTFSGSNPLDFAQTNNCPTSILAGGTCTVSVTFTPGTTGARSANLNVNLSANSPSPVSLTGTGAAAGPAVTLLPSSLSFASQPLHTVSAGQTVTLTNTGTASLTITSISLSGANGADFTRTQTCSTSLVAGASCSVTIQFAPNARGTRTATLSISDNAPGSPHTASLSGTCPNPVPTLAQTAPLSAVPGAPGFTLSLLGANFVRGASVLWNGATRATTYVNAGQLNATISAADVSSAITAQLSVSNPTPGGGVSNAIGFAVTSPTSGVSTGRTDLGVGTNPRGTIAADFNGDRKADVAVVNRDTANVSILLGNGDGTFKAAVNYATGSDPVNLAAGDLNNDGKLDLVVANRASYTVSVLLGNGDGTFRSHVDYAAGVEPLAVATGDFNGDGYLDVAEINAADGTVSIFLGNGNGTLQAAVPYSVGSSPIMVVSGDFNGDANLDLAVADSGANNIAVLLGNGDGTFKPAAFYGTGDAPDGIVAADFNGDGRLDLASANNGNNTVSVLLNSASGTFSPATTYPVNYQPFSISAADFFGNGKISLAISGAGDNTVLVLPGNGDGTFNSASSLSFGVAADPLSIAVADFNGDGRADLASSSATANSVSILSQAPVLSLSPASFGFGSQNTGSSTLPQTLSVTNTGSAALSVSGITITGSNPLDFSQSNTCGSSLAPGANCSVSLTFTPQATGTRSANVSITDNAAGSPQLVSLLGTGVAPGISLAPAGLTFAAQVIGTSSASQAITLTSTGTAALNITSIAASGDYSQTNNCGTSVAAGGSCTITVSFTPSATGTRGGSITVTDNATGSPQSASLTGTGTAAPVVSLSPSSLTFASQAINSSSAAQAVTLSNTGGGTLTISGIAAAGDYSQTNNCGTSLAASGSCTINLVFTPTVIGTRTGSITITDNAAGSPHTVTTTGTGASAAVSLSPTSLTFSNQMVSTTSASQGVTLTNTTGATLSLTSITASGDFGQTNNCASSLAINASCTITVTFTPATTGTRSGSITLVDNAAGGTQSVPLTGTGIAPAVSLSPASLSFGNQTVGATSSASGITLSNTGTASLTISGVSLTGANGAEYSQTNTCGATVAAGASCSINVSFTPAATGTRSASVSVSDNATGTPHLASLTGTGIAPVASTSPSTLTFADQAVGTSSAASVVTLSNTGNAALTITSITIGGANSTEFTQTNTCGTSLAVGSTCTVSVIFTPGASGTRTASVSIADNAAGSPQTVSLTGSGTSASVTLTTDSVIFANQAVGTGSTPFGVTLFNTGSASLTISSITFTGTNAPDFSQTNNCGSTLLAGSNCTINFVFTPSAAGTRTATASINDSATGSPQVVVLSGTGTTGSATATLSPATLSFGSVNVRSSSSPQTVTLTNSGTGTLNIISIVASGDFSQTNNCGSSLAGGASCAVQVTFTPSYSGARTGYLVFSDTDPSNLQTATLTGTGTTTSSTVSIAPRQASVTPGQTQQFQASINGKSSSAVTWAVDGISGGNSTVGTISSSGLYTAPSGGGSHMVKATSTANTSQTASVPVVVTTFAGMYVYHNDDGRTGQNLNETVLTTGNVNSAQFGKLFSYTVDGQIYAQPLYVSNVNVSGVGVRNVVYVVTEHDSVYAFDADGLSSSPLWSVSFINPAAGVTTLSNSDVGGCSNISPEIGITSTPVIDPLTSTMYVLARTRETSGSTTSYVQKLHALNIASGAEVSGSPVTIQASVQGSTGTVTFNPQTQNQRAGLFIANGVVYIAWASHCDYKPFNGWIIGYNTSSLQQAAVYNTTPDGEEGGIWQSGAAPAVDSFGNIYVMNGNGTFDANTGGSDYGEALEKLAPSGGTLTVADYFTPSNYESLNESDLDLGGGGPLLLPDQPTQPTQLMVASGKEGAIYLLDRTNLGKYSPSANQILQCFPAGTVPNAHSMPAFWQNNVYFAGVGDYVKSYRLYNGLLSTAPTSLSAKTVGYPGATPVISANGNSNGVLWMLSTVQGFAAALRAYDAADLSRELYNSNQNGTPPGMATKFQVPTVANGKVYFGTQTELDVYGLLP